MKDTKNIEKVRVGSVVDEETGEIISEIYEGDKIVRQQQDKNIKFNMQDALNKLKLTKSSYYKLIKKYEQEHQVSLLKK